MKHVFISAHLNIIAVVTNSMDNILSQCLYVIVCYHVVINCDLDHFVKTLLPAIKNINSYNIALRFDAHLSLTNLSQDKYEVLRGN